MDSEARLYEVTRTITIRRLIPTPSQEDVSTNLKNAQKIEGWEILDQQEPVVHEIPVPKIAVWEPCIWVEYDESWNGEGLPRSDGETAYIPRRLVKALGIEVAFEIIMGIDPTHILRWDEIGDPLYTRTGDFWETTLPEMTLQEFATQAFRWPLAYDAFADNNGHVVLIIEEQQTLLKKTELLVLTFSLFVPTREKAVCTWTMSGGVDTEQLAAIAKLFAPDHEAEQVKGKATPA